MTSSSVNSLWRGQQTDVLLIQLYSQLQPSNVEPFSVEVLAGALKRDSPEVSVHITIVDERHPGYQLEQLFPTLDASPPKVIGLSVPQGTLRIAKDILRYCTTSPALEHARVLLGHEIPTRYPEAFREIDPTCAIVRGWGDGVIAEAVRSLMRTDRPGPLTWVGAWSTTPATPIRVGSANEYVRRVEASRGCAYGVCSFCARPWRTQRASRCIVDLACVADQVADLERFGATKIAFSDEDFCPTRDELMAMVDLMSYHDLEYQAAIRPETALPKPGETWAQRLELLQRARSSGLTEVFMGIESLIPAQEKRYRKNRGGPETRIAALRMLEQAGIAAEIGLIIFDPLVTVEEIRQTANIILSEGTYRFIGFPFGTIHLREGSTMCEAPEIVGCRGDFIPDTLEWLYSFSHPHAGDIHQRCMIWWAPLENACGFARNLLRSWSGHPEIRMSVVQRIEAIRRTCAIVLRDACDESCMDGTTANWSTKHMDVLVQLRAVEELVESSRLFSDDLLNSFRETIKQAQEEVVQMSVQ